MWKHSPNNLSLHVLRWIYLCWYIYQYKCSLIILSFIAKPWTPPLASGRDSVIKSRLFASPKKQSAETFPRLSTAVVARLFCSHSKTTSEFYEWTTSSVNIKVLEDDYSYTWFTFPVWITQIVWEISCSFVSTHVAAHKWHTIYKGRHLSGVKGQGSY